jgi:hypothetical protein
VSSPELEAYHLARALGQTVAASPRNDGGAARSISADDGEQRKRPSARAFGQTVDLSPRNDGGTPRPIAADNGKRRKRPSDYRSASRSIAASDGDVVARSSIRRARRSGRSRIVILARSSPLCST